MIAVIALDNKMGISFNGRPCSRDAEIIKRIDSMGSGSPPPLTFHDEKLDRALYKDNIYFFSRENPDTLIDLFDRVVIYQWNRNYPSDVKFTSDLSDFVLVSTSEFAGKSHDTITEHIYMRKEFVK